MNNHLRTFATKFVSVKNMDEVTLSFLRQHAESYKREFATQIKPLKISMDVSKYVVRPNLDGTITLLAPLL